MGGLILLTNSMLFRIWLTTVIPATATFVAVAVIVHLLVRHRLSEAGAALGLPEGLLAVGSDGAYLALGTATAILVATVCLVSLRKWTLQPLCEISRLTRELGKGNFGARAEPANLGTGPGGSLGRDLNMLADMLERTERVRCDLVADLAHEIRTPLTNLQGYLEAWQDGLIEPTGEALASVHEEVIRMAGLVGALHQLARADALRQQKPELAMTNLDSLAEQLVSLVKPDADNREIRLEIQSGACGSLVPVHADSAAQVMRNLLRNAVQYTDKGGEIRVQTGVSAGMYSFTCLNSGPGIAPQDLPFVFNRFYRSESARRSVHGGVGLGLAIARELVEAHGGRIGANSKAGWTTVWFEIPLTQRQAR